MTGKAVRLLLLAVLCTAALWSPAPSQALDYEHCPNEYCGFWRNVCENNTGTFVQTSVGYCLDDNENITVLFEGTCTYTWRGPWTIDCTGI